MSYVDVQVAPWFLRLRRVLKPYRGWPDPEPESRLEKWLEAMEADVDVRATTSGDELYLDSYERYAGEFSAPFPLQPSLPSSCKSDHADLLSCRESSKYESTRKRGE